MFSFIVRVATLNPQAKHWHKSNHAVHVNGMNVAYFNHGAQKQTQHALGTLFLEIE